MTDGLSFRLRFVLPFVRRSLDLAGKIIYYPIAIAVLIRPLIECRNTGVIEILQMRRIPQLIGVERVVDVSSDLRLIVE